PVEFTRLVERMYADGVRLFVEAGPRGNLSAFVEDVLRGRACAALPANVARRPGLTQLNHLVAQLTAHHLPLNLGHLYARRAPPRVDRRAPARAPRARAGGGGGGGPPPPRAPPRPRSGPPPPAVGEGWGGGARAAPRAGLTPTPALPPALFTPSPLRGGG